MENECGWVVNDIHIGQFDEPERNCDVLNDNVVIVKQGGEERIYSICDEHLGQVEKLADDQEVTGRCNKLKPNTKEVKQMVMNEVKVITTTPKDIRECIRASIKGFVQQRYSPIETYKGSENELIDQLTAHLYGNVTLALIGREMQAIRHKFNDLTNEEAAVYGDSQVKVVSSMVCDSCTEWFVEQGLNVEELTTGELADIVYNTGYMVGDHTCDETENPQGVCVCSGHSS